MRDRSKDFSVFEFKSDDPTEAGNKLGKYQFLEAFSSGSCHLKQPDVSTLSLIDLQEVDSPERSTLDRNVVSTEEKYELDDVKACSRSYHEHTKICNCDFEPESLVRGLVMGTSAILAASAYDEDSELHSSEEPVNMMSDEEESCTSASETSSINADFPESDGYPECKASELCHSACGQRDDNKNTVVVFPDYVNYRGTLFLESQLTFCSDCIKIECSESSRSDEKLNLVRDIADIIRIACQWSRSVDALLFMFWIKTNASHDVEKFIASIAGEFCVDIDKKIQFLAERYKDIWTTFPDCNYTLEDDMLRTQESFSKRYFSEIMESFTDVIYPKGDPDAVSISKRDIELLKPDTFINDTIIDFYIKYLQKKVQPNEKRRFHFFNSFFFRKLADLDKDPGSISHGRAAFQRVRKWTRKFNIFEKDYIFIPVNFNLHWSLLVICHPGEIITFVDNDLKNSPKVPCILHMDSIKGSHSGLKDLIQSYLLEEWRERHPEFADDITARFLNLRFVSLELPQQENSSDCGLFLLHYVELFLEEAPAYFNPTRITKLSNFLSADWFPPAEASFKRFHIRGLLYELLRDSSQKQTPTYSNGDFPCSGDDCDQAVALEFLSAEDSPSKIGDGSASTLLVIPGNNFEQTATFASPHPRTCLEKELGDAKADITENLIGEGNEDSSDQLVAMIKNLDDCHLLVGSPTQICLTSYSVNDPGSRYLPCIPEQPMEAVVDTFPTILNDHQLAISGEKDGTQKLTSVVDGCTFMPDNPITSGENLSECVRSSQEMDDGNSEVEKHDDPRNICGFIDDHCDNDEKYLKTGTKEMCEEADTSEIENDKADHCLQNQTIGANCKVEENSSMAEDGGDQEMSPPQNVAEVSDSQENNFVKEMSKQSIDTIKEDQSGSNFHDSGIVEVISLDNDVVQPKRNRISESVQQVSKRRKVLHQDIRRRVTRSSSKECAS
ncbi:probable ubiquitin-like-specific protease 2B [Phalaenopsis equestris]|uniref:probable ubiquitin-like-specific protease 2B n=1 Tax=Phalaenopsis equestris TaxID=78828 RepID=UPI0009E1A015|nr:probable ubiquitin-like-specific protease 2B [Phalaenopsis equestris]